MPGRGPATQPKVHKYLVEHRDVPCYVNDIAKALGMNRNAVQDAARRLSESVDETNVRVVMRGNAWKFVTPSPNGDEPGEDVDVTQVVNPPASTTVKDVLTSGHEVTYAVENEQPDQPLEPGVPHKARVVGVKTPRKSTQARGVRGIRAGTTFEVVGRTATGDVIVRDRSGVLYRLVEL